MMRPNPKLNSNKLLPDAPTGQCPPSVALAGAKMDIPMQHNDQKCKKDRSQLLAWGTAVMLALCLRPKRREHTQKIKVWINERDNNQPMMMGMKEKPNQVQQRVQIGTKGRY
jgi:hypothetical protein